MLSVGAYICDTRYMTRVEAQNSYDENEVRNKKTKANARTKKTKTSKKKTNDLPSNSKTAGHTFIGGSCKGG